MGEQINKAQIIDATIGVLSNICVPGREREITEKIDGAINNLLTVKQMLQAEEQINGKPEEDKDHGKD